MVYWIWLTQIKRIGPKKQRKLLEKFNTPENIYKKTLEELLECDGIGYNMAEKIIKERSLEKAEKILNNVKKQNIKLLTLKNPLYPMYPTEAKNIKEMPVLIYYKGNLIENSMGVSIVGSRRCSQYGKKVATNVSDYLARENIWVISGMAKGIDSYAHTSCIKAGGYTIAVLGNGLDICYPQEHIELMKKIIQNGAVISEYPPGTRPGPKHFPRRNLLISGWSYKILIVEAGAKSGALITADYGKKYKRQVLALPDNIYGKESIGSNRLIGNGAKIYLNKEQLLINNRYERESTSIDNLSVNHCILKELDDMEKEIIKILLAEGEKTLEQLSFFTGINTMNLVEKLSIMELENKVIIQGSVVKAVCPLETLSKRI